jgi:hypothetical protein
VCSYSVKLGIIILRLHLSVHASEQEVTGSHSIRAEKVCFSALLGLGRYNMQPTDMAGYGPSRNS